MESRHRGAFLKKLSTLKALNPSELASEEAAFADELISQYGPDAQFTYDTFCSVLNVSQSYISRLLFDAVKGDSKLHIDLHQLAETLATLQFGTRKKILDLLFHSFDSNNDGNIDKIELTALLAATCSDSGIQMQHEEMEELAQAMIDACHDESGASRDGITFDEFQKLVEQHPRFLQVLRFQGLATTLPSKNWRGEWLWTLKLYIRAHWIPALFITTSIAALLAGLCFLLLWPALVNKAFYHLEEEAIIIARITAAFAIAAATCILFPVTKLVVDRLRETIAANYLNFDWAFSIHAILGYGILISGICHGVSWLIIFSTMANTPSWVNDDPEYSTVSTFGASSRSFHGLCTSEVAITGYIMLGSLFLGFPFATTYPRRLKWVRETRIGALLNNFNAFFLTHRVMAVVFIVALLLHPLPGIPQDANLEAGSIAWIFLAVPVLLYLLNFALTLRRMNKGKVEVVSYHILEGDVLHLEFKRPDTKFKFKAGQWVQLRIPDVSKSEWHPFRLSSAPSDPHLTCHIKTAGDWTQAVHQKFAHLLESNQPPSEPPVPFSIYVDGPFGSPAQDYTKYPVAVFVAAGIGATPMVSVLREVSAKITKSKLKLAQISDNKKPQSCWPHTLYFHWIVRQQAAVQFWFSSILQEVLAADSLAQVHIDIWFTGGGSTADMRSLVMLLAEDIAREKTGVELITGIASDRLNVHFQRPSWKMEFDELIARHGKQDRKVGVFCCGPALLEQDLKDMCLERSSGGSGLKFVLRPERF